MSKTPSFFCGSSVCRSANSGVRSCCASPRSATNSNVLFFASSLVRALTRPRAICSRYHTVFRRSRMATISTEHHDSVLIIIVVIKPAGPDDGIGMTAGPDQTLGTSFPVMNLSALIPGAEPFSHANRGHLRRKGNRYGSEWKGRSHLICRQKGLMRRYPVLASPVYLKTGCRIISSQESLFRFCRTGAHLSPGITSTTRAVSSIRRLLRC